LSGLHKSFPSGFEDQAQLEKVVGEGYQLKAARRRCTVEPKFRFTTIF